MCASASRSDSLRPFGSPVLPPREKTGNKIHERSENEPENSDHCRYNIGLVPNRGPDANENNTRHHRESPNQLPSLVALRCLFNELRPCVSRSNWADDRTSAMDARFGISRNRGTAIPTCRQSHPTPPSHRANGESTAKHHWRQMSNFPVENETTALAHAWAFLSLETHSVSCEGRAQACARASYQLAGIAVRIGWSSRACGSCGCATTRSPSTGLNREP